MRVAILTPAMPERVEFRQRYVAPGATANVRRGGRDIRGMSLVYWVLDSQPGGACEKRNRLAASCPDDIDALLFLDDDVALAADCVQRMARALDHSGAAVAYCDYQAVDLGGCHPQGPVWTHKAQPWDYQALRRGNYISTMSLVLRDAFDDVGGWDEELHRFQDWDLWLRMGAAGHAGVYVPEVLFHAYYLPGESITARHDYDTARKLVEEKHGL